MRLIAVFSIVLISIGCGSKNEESSSTSSSFEWIDQEGPIAGYDASCKTDYDDENELTVLVERILGSGGVRTAEAYIRNPSNGKFLKNQESLSQTTDSEDNILWRNSFVSVYFKINWVGGGGKADAYVDGRHFPLACRGY